MKNKTFFRILDVITVAALFTWASTASAFKVGGLNWVTTDGTANQCIKTNGSGSLGWLTVLSPTGLSATSPLTYNSSTGVFAIPVADSTDDGYLAQGDWINFNNRITGLTGDVTATGPTGSTGPENVAATVAAVGGSTAANVHAAELLANAATNLNTASTIVKRDGSGNFTAGTITAALTGTATNSTNAVTTATSTSSSFYLTFVSSSSSGNQGIRMGSGVTVNPSTSVISATGLNLSGLTVSQGVVTDSSGNLASLGYSITPTASNLVERDSNGNAKAVNHVSSGTNVVSGGTTTTLTAASSYRQQLTGSSAQNFVLPDATTLAIGWAYLFNNNSTGTLTVKDGGSSTLFTIPAGGASIVWPVAVSTTAGSWDWHSLTPSNVTWGTATLAVPAVTTTESNPATGSFLNLANNGNGIGFRNAANSGNITVNVNGSNQLTYNGAALFSSGGILTAAAFPAMTGDVTSSAGSLATSLVATSNGTITTLSGLTTASSLASIGTITSGVWHGTAVATTYGGTGIDSSGVTNGQLLIGATSGHTFALAAITGTSNEVVVTNGANSITLSTPQDIGTSSAPQFGGLGIGTAAVSTNGITESLTFSNASTSTQVNGVIHTPIIAQTVAARTAAAYGVDSLAEVGSTNTQNWTGAIASNLISVGAEAKVLASATGTISNATGLYAHVSNLASGATVTNAYGIVVDATTATGTVTSTAGIALANQSGATNNTHILLGTTTIPSGQWALYDGSSASSAIHQLRVGSTTGPTATLDVTGSLAVSTTSTLTGNTGVGGAADPFSRGYGKVLSVTSASDVGMEVNAATGNAATVDLGVNGSRTAQLVSSATSTTLQTLGSTSLNLGANNTTAMTIDSSNKNVSLVNWLAVGGASAANSIGIRETAPATADTNGLRGYQLNMDPIANNDGTYNWNAIEINSDTTIATGKTNSGEYDGIQVNHIRDIGSSDAGTLATMAAMDVAYGNYSVGTGGTTTNAYGVLVHPYHRSGTITSSYGVYVATPTTGGTVTNQYGFYQQSTGALNTFAGNTRIGSTSDATATLDVTGTLKVSGSSGLSGNVGINMAAPAGSTRLQLETAGDGSNDFIVRHTGATVNPGLFVKTSESGLSVTVQAGASTSASLLLYGSGGSGMTVGSTGNVTFDAQMINTHLTTGTNADTVCLKSDGTFLIQAAACTISSRRFKENIEDFQSSALDEVMAMRTVTFNMKQGATPNPDTANFARTQVGLIAEEIEAIDPRLSVYEPDGKTPKSYRQEAMIALLVKAVQEQQKEIDSLKKQLGE